jgi:hypothetical protein
MYKVELLALITGIDISIAEYEVKIHQPTINEIALMGEERFFSLLNLFNLNVDSLKNTIRESLVNAPLEEREIINYLDEYGLLLFLVNTDDTFKNLFLDLCKLILKDYKVDFLDYEIILRQEETMCVFNSNLYYIIKDIIYQIFLFEKFFTVNEVKPVNDKAKQIADKLKRSKEKIKNMSQNDNNEDKSFFANIISVLGVKNDISELNHLTVYQLYNKFERFNLYLQYDQSIRALMAGAQIEIIDKVLDDIYFAASCTDGLEEYSNAYYDLLAIRDRKTILEQELKDLEKEKR